MGTDPKEIRSCKRNSAGGQLLSRTEQPDATNYTSESTQGPPVTGVPTVRGN